MHIKKANGKKNIVMSRKEWETIGKKAGWTSDWDDQTMFEQGSPGKGEDWNWEKDPDRNPTWLDDREMFKMEVEYLIDEYMSKNPKAFRSRSVNDLKRDYKKISKAIKKFPSFADDGARALAKIKKFLDV